MKNPLLVVSSFERLPTIGFVTLLIAKLLISGLFSPAVAADPARGKLLYENTCSDCHESKLHLRERRKARSFDQIKTQVVRWSTAAKAHWNLEEIEDVADFLNAKYYRYPCEPEQCSFSADTK